MTSVTHEIPQLAVNLADPTFNADPYPVLEQIRTLGPVVFNEHGPDGYMLTGFKDNQRVLGNPLKFPQLQEFFIDTFGGLTFEAIDDRERHDEIRAVWQHDFTRDFLFDHRTSIVDRVVDSKLGLFVERIQAGETVDAYADLVRDIPAIVMAELMGLAKDAIPQFTAWSATMGLMLDGFVDPTPNGPIAIAQAKAATAELNEYLAGVIRERTAGDGDDLISQLARSTVATTMSEQDVVAQATQLVFAGNDTTSKLLGHAIIVLAGHPDQREVLRQDRSLVPQAVEEVLRYETVSQTGSVRFVGSEDVTFGDYVVPAGSLVQTLLGAANRDPDRWERPLEFDILRRPVAHLGFGFGMHSCLGQNLGRLQCVTLINKLLDQAPGWGINGVPTYQTFMSRGPSYIPLELG